MADKAVQSSGSTGPRDFSAAVHSNIARRAPQPHITVQVWLSDEEAAKVTQADVSAAVSELLARLGVEQGQVEVAGPDWYDLWLFRARDWEFARRLAFATSQDRDRFVSAYLPVAPLLGGDGFYLCPRIPEDLPEATRQRAESAVAHQLPDGRFPAGDTARQVPSAASGSPSDNPAAVGGHFTKER